MAEGLFRQALPHIAVCSAGIDAIVGSPADPLSIQLMWERGVDISTHRAKNVAGWMMEDAELIITMDLHQQLFIERVYPSSLGRVVRLGRYGNYDVPDPYRKDIDVFRHSCNLIARGVDELVNRSASTIWQERFPMQSD